MAEGVNIGFAVDMGDGAVRAVILRSPYAIARRSLSPCCRGPAFTFGHCECSAGNSPDGLPAERAKFGSELFQNGGPR